MELIIFTKFKIKQTTFVTSTAIYLGVYSRKTLWIFSTDQIDSRNTLFKRKESCHLRLSFTMKFFELLNQEQVPNN